MLFENESLREYSLQATCSIVMHLHKTSLLDLS